jgi:hypothetical protein
MLGFFRSGCLIAVMHISPRQHLVYAVIRDDHLDARVNGGVREVGVAVSEAGAS